MLFVVEWTGVLRRNLHLYFLFILKLLIFYESFQKNNELKLAALQVSAQGDLEAVNKYTQHA